MDILIGIPVLFALVLLVGGGVVAAIVLSMRSHRGRGAVGRPRGGPSVLVWLFLLPLILLPLFAVGSYMLFGLAPTWISLLAGSLLALLLVLGFVVTGSVIAVTKARTPARVRPSTMLAPGRRRPAQRPDLAPTGTRPCPNCGDVLPADAPEGLCPRCLLQSGLANPSPVLSPGGTTPHPGQFVAPAPAGLAPHFPQLEILELVGQGGMGAVYKARQTKLDRLVALKILPPEWGGDPAFAERFTREARALARLNHPHIVAVHDFGETGGLFYLLMEFVDGGNLRQLLQAGPLPPEQALAVIPQLCDALEYAHEEGIVHRDVKPENILLDRRGRVKIADFGLAKLLGKPRAEFTLTASHQVMGTLDYMAPEQRSRPQEIDHRADIYSLGVVFYEMLTGELPLGRFAPPSRRTGVDPRVDEVLFRALETDPEQRYQSAAAFKTDIQSGGGAPSGVQAGMELMHRPSPRAAEGARRRVSGPARGLLVMGIFQCMCLTGFGIQLAREVGDRLHFDDHGMPFIYGLSTSDRIGDALLLGWCVLGSLAGPVLVQAGLRMMRLRSYRLAWFVSVLAMLPLSPTFLLGLPLGSWALIVLRDPEVEAAFAAEARRTAAFRKRRVGEARERVRGPAIGLLTTGILQCVCLAVMGATPAVALVELLRDDRGLLRYDLRYQLSSFFFQTAAPLGWCLLGIGVGAVLVGAGLRMLWLRSYRLAVFGSVLALIPCSPLFLLGLPVGVWALVVLREPDVEAAFAAAAFRRREEHPAPRPTGPVRRRMRSFLRSVRSLMFFSSPKQAPSPTDSVSRAERDEDKQTAAEGRQGQP